MKLFISTVGILILSLFFSQTSTQGVVIGGYPIKTYSESEILLSYLSSRVKLSLIDVKMLSLEQDMKNNAENIRTESFEEIIHTLDTLQNEITPPAQDRNR